WSLRRGRVRQPLDALARPCGRARSGAQRLRRISPVIRADRAGDDACYTPAPTVPARRERQGLPVVDRERGWARTAAVVGWVRRREAKPPVHRAVQRASPTIPKCSEHAPKGCHVPADRRLHARRAAPRIAGAPASGRLMTSEPAPLDRSTLADDVACFGWYHTLDLGGDVITKGMFDHRP